MKAPEAPALVWPRQIEASYSSLRDAVLNSMPAIPNFALALASVPALAPSIDPSPAHVPYVNGHRSVRQQMLMAPAHTPQIDQQITTPNPGPSQHRDPQPTLRQSDFTYEEVTFIDVMTRCWIWYLAVEDCFPAIVLAAQEACIAYAEKILDVSRTDFPNMRRMFTFVSTPKFPNVPNVDSIILFATYRFAKRNLLFATTFRMASF